ncbi:sulfite reductase [NADPH] flavoprotein component [Coemansia sp. Benny D115]|nr:sulfite reductase [NADPH] flavoprotein component [Coemansia sp. Benny D115]
MASAAVVAAPVSAGPTPSLIVGLRLGGKKAAVFGSDSAAITRATFALDAGASVVLYSSAGNVPKALAKWSAAGRITAVPSSKYSAADLSAVSVVFATDNATAATVAQDAHAAGVPVNVSGSTTLSDFTLLPTYRGDGGLQVAVTTNGVAPRVAQRLLSEIVGRLPDNLEPQLAEVARLSAEAAEAERRRQAAVAKLEAPLAAEPAASLSTEPTAANTPAPESVAEQRDEAEDDSAAVLDALRVGGIATADAQVASAYTAHALSDLCFVYAAPEQSIGAAALAWSRRAEKNAFGEWVSALRMQTRAGAGHALWGALSSGARVAAIASAESLPHMAPVLAELAERKQPLVVHATAESLDAAGEAHADHTDALVVLQTGAAILASASAQEAQDVAAIAHAVSAAAAVPVVHVSSASASASAATVRSIGHEQLAAFTSSVATAAAAAGSSTAAKTIDVALAQFRSAFGRTYARFEYSGSASAQTVFVALGQPAADAVSALPALLHEQPDVGVLNVRALRPWAPEQLVAALPSTVRRVVVLGCARDAAADALRADVALAALVGRPAAAISVSGANVFATGSAGVANAMRIALGLPELEKAEEQAVEEAKSAEAEGETTELAAPTATVATSLDVAKRLVFPEAYGTELVARPGERTFDVRVATKYRMTPTSYDRNIFHIEFDTRGTDLKYEIGDALGVFGCNDSKQVLEFCALYGLDPHQLVTAARDGEQAHTRSVFSWLTNALDLFGRPSKNFYASLAELAADPEEAEKLRWLTTSEGAIEFKDRVADTITYADLLLEFASARPEFVRLVDLIAPIKPRHYSIASSAKMHPGSVHLCVVAVDWKDSKGRTRTGQCTRFLNALNAGDLVVVTVKPSVMKLPPLDSQPVIMAGLGTGMAPFRAFIEERAVRKMQGAEVGPMTLYFGSRHRAMEYLYGEELEAYHADGLLTNLRLAFSRDQKEKIYIQHRMRQDADILASQMLKEEGSFYLCGPTWPTGDVKDAMVNAFTTLGGVKSSEANKVIEELKESERYILEHIDTMSYGGAPGNADDRGYGLPANAPPAFPHPMHYRSQQEQAPMGFVPPVAAGPVAPPPGHSMPLPPPPHMPLGMRPPFPYPMPGAQAQPRIRHPNRPPCTKPSNTLYIRNLNEKTKLPTLASALRALFETYGPLLDVRVRHSVRMRGQAFVVFAEREHAVKAHGEVQGFMLFGKPMFIEYSRAPSDASVAQEGGDLEAFKKQRVHDREAREKEAQRRKALPGGGSSVAMAVPPGMEIPNRILFLQGLPKDIAVSEIESAFASFEGLVEVRWVQVKPDVAFVEFASEAQAAYAKSSLGSQLKLRENNTPVSVTFAKR